MLKCQPIIVIFLAFTAVISFSGCQSTPTEVVTKLPEWVKKPPQDTSNIFYGIGNGYSLESANSAALKNVTSKLGVTVSSIYKQREQITNSHYQKYVDDQVNLSVDSTPISNYQILKNEAINGQVYSLLKVEKSQLLTDIKQSLYKENAKASALFNKKSTMPNLVWSLESKKLIKASSDDAYRFASIINLLSPSQNINTNVKPWVTLMDSLSIAEKNLCLHIVNTDKKSQDFVTILRTHASAQKIKVTSRCKEKLLVSSQDQNRFIYEKHISTVELKLEYQPTPNSIEASKVITLSGQSISSKNNARKASVYSLTSILNNQNLWQLLDIL